MSIASNLECEVSGTRYQEEYPAKVSVSGLPFAIQGWNGEYYRTSERSFNGAPKYGLDDYILYGIFPIIGVTLEKLDGRWHLVRNCDVSPTISRRNSSGLLGNWNSYGMTVTDATKTSFDWSYLGLGLAALVVAGLVYTKL